MAGPRHAAPFPVNIDPEPLPPDHPLWSLDGVLITPHVGGNSTAMDSRVVRLLLKQIAALLSDARPANVVIEPKVER